MAMDELQPVAAAAEAMRGPAPKPARAGPVVEPVDPAAWGFTYVMQMPVKVDGVVLDTVAGRAITVGEMARLVMEDDGEDSVSLRARALACGLHPDVFMSLSAVDGAAIAELLRPFLPAGLVAAEDEVAEVLAAPR
jgi:hypothetical protein